MTPEEKAMLENTYALVKENNNMLRSVHRSQRWGTIMKIAYWAVIIILSLGAVYFIQPYFQFLQGLNGNSGGSSYSQQIQDLIK